MRTSIFVILLLFLVFIGIGVVGYSVYVGYQYDKQIGSYIENSIDMVSPEPMLNQLNLAEQGMRDSGLTDEDYGAVFFKKPDNSMKFQYQHINAIKERINAVIDWKEKSYGNESTSSETLGDVYETKMTNLRHYINSESSTSIGGDRSDWIAKDAWYIKNHIFLYFEWIFWVVWIILIGLLIIAKFALNN